MRTHIVVTVFHQEGYPLALGAGAIAVPLQFVLCGGDIIDEFSVCKRAARKGVNNRGALGIVLLYGLEDGQAG